MRLIAFTMLLPRILGIALLAFGAMSPAVASEQPSIDPDAYGKNNNAPIDAPSEIEVRGQRQLDEDTVSDGIRDIAVSRLPNEPRAQFSDPLCLHVQGLGRKLSERVGNRVRAHAVEVGIDIADEGCTTNAFILVVDRPAVLIERLRETMPALFDHRVTGRIRREAELGNPVISWNVQRLSSRFSNGPIRDGAINAGGGLFDNQVANVPTARGLWPTRLRNAFGIARTGAFVVFDVRQLNNIHIRQLADYATMQLLATPRRQIEVEELAAPTILTLFEEDALKAPRAMTRLDWSYLKGLYALRPTDWGSRLMTSAKKVNANLPAEDGERP